MLLRNEFDTGAQWVVIAYSGRNTARRLHGAPFWLLATLWLCPMTDTGPRDCWLPRPPLNR